MRHRRQAHIRLRGRHSCRRYRSPLRPRR